MNGTRFIPHLYGWLCVLLAVIFYGNFRSETLIAQYLSFFHFSELSTLQLPSFIELHLPSFLQASFIGYLAFCLIKPAPRKPFYVGMIAFTTTGLLEIMQSVALLPGIFDYLDLLAIAIASAFISYLIRDKAETSSRATSKTRTLLVTPAFLGACFVSMGCSEDCDPDEYTCVEPVTLTWSELRADISPVYGNDTTLTSTGKVYVNGNHLFIIDNYRGVHIFNQTDNQNPTRIVFIPIPGALNLSIQGDKIYVNSFTDFLVINYQKILDGEFDQSHLSRQENMFMPPILSNFLPDDYALEGEEDDYDGFIAKKSNNTEDLPSKGFIIGYEDDDDNKILYGEYDDTDTDGDE